MTESVPVKNVLAKYWFDLSDWFSSTRYFNEDSFVTRIRYFQITAFSFLFITSFFNFLLRADRSYAVTSTACMLLIVVRFLLDSHQVKTAYYLLLLTINAVIVLLTCMEGLQTGAFLYFFPCIISFSFIADNKRYYNMLFTYLVGFGSFMLAILLAPGSTSIQELVSTGSLYNISHNIIISFFLVGWMSYTLAKENNRKQTVLMNKEVFLDTIFNSSLHSEIIVEEENGLISSYNKHAITLFAPENGDSLVNKPVRELFATASQTNALPLFSALLIPAETWEGELTCHRTDGSDFPGKISMVSFSYLGRNFKKITIVDITEKNQMLEELQEAKLRAEESVQVKSQFLSHMSHELRTPLNGIIGSANLLLQEDCQPGQREQLNVLKFSSEHMLTLINDILDLSKLEANKIQLERAAIEFPDFIHNITSPFIPQFENKGLAFEVSVDESLRQPVSADPTRLNQVLTNLLSNALKFTAKGYVKVEVKAVALNEEAHTIEFSVTDTGIGIATDKREKIFEQFSQADVKTTRKYGGTGLGLTISRELVKLMGGDLQVESKYLKGSRFYFRITLPVHTSGKKPSFVTEQNLPAENSSDLRGIRVLIAEDNPINMMIASKFLDKWGVVYEKAKNGLEAVSKFKAGSFDVVLMDLEMPEMDGYGALNEIRGMNTSTPAIAFTAAVFENMQDNLKEKGFNDFIQKPFRPNDLQAKLVSFSGKLKKIA